MRGFTGCKFGFQESEIVARAENSSSISALPRVMIIGCPQQPGGRAQGAGGRSLPSGQSRARPLIAQRLTDLSPQLARVSMQYAPQPPFDAGDSTSAATPEGGNIIHLYALARCSSIVWCAVPSATRDNGYETG